MNHKDENCSGTWWFERDYIVCLDCKAQYKQTETTIYEALMENTFGLVVEELSQEGEELT